MRFAKGSFLWRSNFSSTFKSQRNIPRHTFQELRKYSTFSKSTTPPFGNAPNWSLRFACAVGTLTTALGIKWKINEAKGDSFFKSYSIGSHAVACEQAPLNGETTTENERDANPFYKYVIVGSGTAAYAALEAIRQQEPNAEILMIVDVYRMQRLDAMDRGIALENDLENVYNEWRRHLQSSLEAFKSPMDGHPDQETEENMPALMLTSFSGITLNLENRKITVADGSTVSFGTCLFAPTGHPKHFYVLESDKMTYSLRGNINTAKTLADFKELERVVKEAGTKRVTVVGGGFLGTELVLALSKLGARELEKSGGAKKLQLTHVFVEPFPLYRHLPKYLSSFIQKEASRRGIQTISERVVTTVENSDVSTVPDDNKPYSSELSLSLMGWQKEEHKTDYVVLASTSVSPALLNLTKSGLELDVVNQGLVANSSLEVYDRVFVAGNLASFYDPVLGRRRMQNYDHAVNSGFCAGTNMVAKMASNKSSNQAQKIKQYRHQPVFRSNLPAIGMTLEGVGVVNSDLETVGVWLANRDEETGQPGQTQQYERGIVYYLRGNTIVGILCCNASECLGMARDVLNQRTQFKTAHGLKNRIQLAPENWVNVISTPAKTSAVSVQSELPAKNR